VPCRRGRHAKDEKVKYKLEREPSFATLPVSGKAAPGVELLDAVMLKYLKKIGCSAASLTVARSHQPGPHGLQPTTDHAPLFSRGYGWCDLKGTVPMQPDTPIGIASCEKSFIAAAIRQMALDGKLDLNGSLFRQLKIKPKGKIVDNRVWDITINHLLDHQAGWQGEPLARAEAAAGDPAQYLSPWDWTAHVLEYVMVQNLRDTPGQKSEYDNFGYGTLATVVDRFAYRCKQAGQLASKMRFLAAP
jgi:CubicO group peptidase (beta-lactamase class C family)